jgi:glycosidase
MEQEKAWIRSTNVYEVNFRQYTPEGTFEAFTPHLSRLKDMGVDTLWFMPTTPISKKNKKGAMGSYYACSDYVSINPEFGTMNDFKRLVDHAHEMGFKVIIDWVANHTGWDHQWTIEHPDWYEKDETTGDFKKASGMDDIIELDFNNADMRLAMIEAMKYWVLSSDIDGFRCDLAFWVQLDFWLQAKKELDKIKPLFWLAESDPVEHPEYMQVFDAAYTWAWMHKTEDYAKGRYSFSELVRILDLYGNTPGIKAWFTSNHDENTWNGTEYEKYGPLAEGLAVFSCTWAGIPLIYNGQELPNLKRLEFFEKDVIEWNNHFELHDFYKKLLELKRNNTALWSDAPVIRIPTSIDDQVLVFKRLAEDKEVMVFLNFTGNNADVYLQQLSGKYRDIFNEMTVDLDTDHMYLAPWQYLVYEKI